MLGHYLKIAWRNLLKYRTQTAVNIVGLAVGFACFALSLIWIRYELTYDRHHKGAERLYLAYRVSPTDATGYDLEVKEVVPLLRESFPEVEAVCGISRYRTGGLNLPGEKAIGGVQLSADSAFMQMFGVRVLAGDADFLHNRDKVAVTENYARRLFGKTDVVGEKVQEHYAGRMTIGAVLSSLPHSSLAFDYCRGNSKRDEKDGDPVLIRLHPDVDIEAFARKTQEYKEVKDGKDTYPLRDVRWMPLTRFHYSDVNADQSVRFTYLVLFAGVGLLVILGSLLNYLALFVTRMRIREREIGLRRVNGASRGSLFVQFATEYALLVVAAGLVGMTLVELALPVFRRMSEVSGGVYGEAFLYFDKLDEPEEVVTEDYRAANGIAISLTDADIRDASTYWAARRERLRPYPECVCLKPCAEECAFERRALARELAKRIFKRFFTAQSEDFSLLRRVYANLDELVRREVNDEPVTPELVACIRMHLLREVKYDTRIRLNDATIRQSLESLR